MQLQTATLGIDPERRLRVSKNGTRVEHTEDLDVDIYAGLDEEVVVAIHGDGFTRALSELDDAMTPEEYADFCRRREQAKTGKNDMQPLNPDIAEAFIEALAYQGMRGRAHDARGVDRFLTLWVLGRRDHPVVDIELGSEDVLSGACALVSI